MAGFTAQTPNFTPPPNASIAPYGQPGFLSNAGQTGLGYAGATYDPTLAAAQVNTAGSLANTQQQGANSMNLANLQGQWQAALQAPQLAEDIQKTGMQTQAGITEAQIGALPQDVQAAIAYQKYQTFAPYQQAILSQLSPLIGSLTGYITGGNLPNFNNPGGAPSIAGGNMSIPQAGGPGVNVPMSAPKSVISPGQASALMGQNAGQGNAATASAYNQFAGGNSALNQQLAGQLAAQNSAGLNQAATNFQAALAPANAQQGLGATQLQELVRNDMLRQAIQGGQIGLQRFQGLTGLMGNVLGGATSLGGLS